MDYSTQVDLVHWVAHEHLVHAKVLIFPESIEVISRRRSRLDLDANSAVDRNSFLGAVHRWQVLAGSHVKVSHS
jgi:hypothetical protein